MDNVKEFWEFIIWILGNNFCPQLEGSFHATRGKNPDAQVKRRETKR